MITAEQLKKHKLTAGEYGHARDVLGREASLTELGVLSVMWSEHCSYKSSRKHLARLPTTGPRVVIGPGENAGVVDVGDGWCVCFKMESHNHPSFIEPRQGAATGVGGILRDVFTMGARPIAALNSLRFGRPEHPKTRHLVDGVVSGIGGYGNCFGVPTVGGEVVFDASYDGNCLVNAFVVGTMKRDAIFLGLATGIGNPVIYVGARTGRDGIHGATMASDEFSDKKAVERPTVQVGDPFQEKLLLEACLELMRSDAIVGIQDMGAAGLTSSSVEMAGRAGNGLLLELDKVPLREEGMTPYELLLSESQERMLIVAKQGREEDVRKIFDKWDLQAVVIGRVTDDGIWRCTWHGEEVCALPVPLLTDEAPKYDRPQARPDWQDAVQVLPTVTAGDASADLLALIGSPDHCSREWIWSRYDHQVGAATVIRPGSDAAVVRMHDTTKAIALTVDGNSRHVYLDPVQGGMGVIAEGARNLACVGAVAVGATDNLNFGNPERPAIMWQIANAIDGLAAGCRALDVPIVSGNVSLYNETDGNAILPTPTVAMVGLIEGELPAIGARLGRAGLEVAVIGALPTHGVGGSSWLARVHGLLRGKPPTVDLVAEKALHTALIKLVREGLVEVAHDSADGGVALALAEICLPLRSDASVGLVGELPGSGDRTARLFGEDHGRVVIAYDRHQAPAIDAVLAGIPRTVVGISGGSRLTLTDAGAPVIDVAIDALTARWRDAMPTYLAGDPWPV